MQKKFNKYINEAKLSLLAGPTKTPDIKRQKRRQCSTLGDKKKTIMGISYRNLKGLKKFSRVKNNSGGSINLWEGEIFQNFFSS